MALIRTGAAQSHATEVLTEAHSYAAGASATLTIQASKDIVGIVSISKDTTDAIFINSLTISGDTITMETKNAGTGTARTVTFTLDVLV